MSKLRDQIKNREKLSGSIVSLTDPALCEILGRAGFDFIWIDTEHTYISYKEVLCHLNAARTTGVYAVVRVPQNDLTFTKKILEMDVDGVIFPMIRTAQEAREAIKMTLYPPLGNRGFGPMRAIGYGAEDAETYTREKSLDICRFIQIEHIDCINNLEEICENEYIDGFIFGPNDLALSLGGLDQESVKKAEEHIRRATEFLHRKGKYVGLAVGQSESEMKKWADLSFDMYVAGADWNYVYAEGKKIVGLLNNYHKKEV